MNILEQKVLHALGLGRDEFGYFSFATITAETGLDRKVVRRACRALARKGLAEYGKGLWSEDGEPAGSGYAITKQGAKALPELSL